jgi:hypothetical protein
LVPEEARAYISKPVPHAVPVAKLLWEQPKLGSHLGARKNLAVFFDPYVSVTLKPGVEECHGSVSRETRANCVLPGSNPEVSALPLSISFGGHDADLLRNLLPGLGSVFPQRGTGRALVGG